MAFSWKYPLFLIQHGGGYAAIADPDPQSASHLLVVLTNEAAAIEFMGQFGILGALKPLKNARELQWLLGSLKAPVDRVAFNPTPHEQSIDADWTVTVDNLVSTLEVDWSPWNYPVFVLAETEGFTAIESQMPTGESIDLLALFSTRQRAEEYIQGVASENDLPHDSQIMSLADVDEARRFLTGMQDLVQAVALDPVHADNGPQAKHCFKLETLLDKYLIKSPEPPVS